MVMNDIQAEAPAPDDPIFQHRIAEVEGVRLHYVEAGQGPLVLLLHGFPEFWYAWRRQIPALAAAGFRVVAPDLRGYNLSGKPKGVRSYRMRALVEDVRQLIAALGERRAHVVGHDWGAAIAWAFAMQNPLWVDRLVILNGPHPERFLTGLFTPRQLLRSWYMFFFQLPWLPEYVARSNDHALLFEAFERMAPHARLTHVERAAYRESFSQPGALRAAIHYYRAMLRPSGVVRLAPIHAPVLVLWGDADPYLGRELATPSARWVPVVRVEYFPGTGHFIKHEQAPAVNARIVEFLGGESAVAQLGEPAGGVSARKPNGAGARISDGADARS